MAAGAIEAIAVVASLQKGRSPVNIGMTEQDKECKVNVVTQAKAHPEKLEYALSNSLGFGGHNAVLAFRKMELNDLDFNDIERLMDDFKKSEIRELEITTDGFHIHLSKNETPFFTST